jgi:hypothetical protein
MSESKKPSAAKSSPKMQYICVSLDKEGNPNSDVYSLAETAELAEKMFREEYEWKLDVAVFKISHKLTKKWIEEPL